MQKKYSQKWAVASFFDDLEVGFTFHAENTPLHATLAGVFAINKSSEDISGLVSDCLVDLESFKVTGKLFEQWGDTRVTTMIDTDNFNKLFFIVQDTLMKSEAIFNEPQYLLDGFRPHVTVQKEAILNLGTKRTIKSVSIVDMFPDSDFEMRRIVKTIRLKL